MTFIRTITIILSSVLLVSCGNKNHSNTQKTTPHSTANKGMELVKKMVATVGNYKRLLSKKDVVYNYQYTTPDGKTDKSTEKYRFDDELSHGLYTQHERTLPNLKGTIEQGYDGTNYWLKQNGAILNDKTALKRVAFNRPTNFYWFTMFQKLLDPGLQYEYLGEKKINAKDYDIVKVTFKPEVGKQTDTYQLYINKKTSLVDQFLFTVVDFGVVDPPFLMQMTYEKIGDMMFPTKRRYKKSSWQDASVSKGPWTKVTWSNIRFNNGLSAADFKQ